MKRAGIAFAVLVAASAGLACVHPFGNPRIEPRKGLDTLLQRADLPEGAKMVLTTKCADCHSNETRWPVYARLAPASWLIERDITQARAQMNLSHWEEMSPDARDVLTAKIIHGTKDGEMPPLQFRAVHWGSRLTPAELATLRSLSGAAVDDPGTETTGDPEHGRLLFQKRCTGCHAMDGDREGPRLDGVFGRKAGTVAGFDYSAGLKKSGVTWNEATLDRWLTNPDSIAPDTKMDFQVPKAQERADLIAYFRR